MNSKLIFTKKQHESNDSLSSNEFFGSRSGSIDSSNEMNSKLIFTKKEYSSNDSLNSTEIFSARTESMDNFNETDYNLNDNSKLPKENIFKSVWKHNIKRRKREEPVKIASSPKVEDVLMKLYIKNNQINDTKK